MVSDIRFLLVARRSPPGQHLQEIALPDRTVAWCRSQLTGCRLTGLTELKSFWLQKVEGKVGYLIYQWG